MIQRIHSDKAPPAIGPYSQAVQAGGFVFVSGQLPVNPLKDELITKPFPDAVHQAIKNLRAILQAANLDLEHLVKVNVYLRDLKNFQTFNEVYAQYFKGTLPARAVVEVSGLPRGADLEIEGVACIP